MGSLRKYVGTNLSSKNDTILIDYVNQMEEQGISNSQLVKTCLKFYMDYYPKKLKLDQFNEKITDNIVSGNIKVSVNGVNPRKMRKKNEVVEDDPEVLELSENISDIPDKKNDSVFINTMNKLMAE